VFQSTLPRGERQSAADDAAAALQFQSTLPRGERHAVAGGDTVKAIVSIHAPTRGATVGADADLVVPEVSIHAPTRGATSAFTFSRSFWCFNPRSHAGSDPVWGYIKRARRCFNPRSHAGSDCMIRCVLRFLVKFQSTLPRGERRNHKVNQS